MRTLALQLLLVITGGGIAAPLQDDDTQLRASFRELALTRSAGDTSAWERLVASDAVFIHRDGRVHTKKDEIQEFQGVVTDTPHEVITDLVRISDGIAVRHFETEIGLAIQVWRKDENGRWKLAASNDSFGAPHESIITPAAADPQVEFR